MRRARVAVIGLGAVAFEHLAKLRARSDVELVGVCDLSPTLARAVAERFGSPPAFTDARAMLSEMRPDSVHVLTPPQSHCELALAAFEAGAHVLVEKPAAPTWEGYCELREAARAHERLLVENYNYRFTAAVRAALALCADGELGDVLAVDASFGGVMGAGYADAAAPHFAHALPGGALQNFVSHPVSLALPFMGPCTGVHAVRRRHDPLFPGDDELRALLVGDAACAVISLSRHARPEHFTLSVQGTRARAEVDVYGDHLEVLRSSSAVAGSVRRGISRIEAAAVVLGRTATGRRDLFGGLAALLDGFYAAVCTGAPPPVTLGEMDAVNSTVSELLLGTKVTA
jgi:predicted dehydrogenase